MTFVTASLAVAGVLAAAIPIIIHLLSRQRRKPIEWAAMRFLLEAMRKHRKRLRAEQLLLLAVRCLIVVLFGAALARPLLTQAGLLDRGGERVVYLLIDDGLASGVVDYSEGAPRTALEGSVQQGIDIIRNLQPGDRVGIATLARPSRLVTSPPSTDHGSAMSFLESLRPVHAPTDIAGALRALRPALEEHAAERTPTYVYLLSELRAGSAPLESPLQASLRELGDHIQFFAPEPVQSPAPNVQITSIEPVRHLILSGAADGSSQIMVRLERHGGELGRDVTRVRLRGDGINRVEPRTVRWEPGQSQASVDFLVGWTAPVNDALQQRRHEVAITAEIDDDSLDADNVRHAVLEFRDHLRVALLDRRMFGYEPTIEGYRSGQWIKRALQPYEGSPIRITEVEPAALSATELRTVDVVVATRPDLVSEDGWTILREYVDRGGLLLVIPPDEMNVHPWADRFTQVMDLPWRIALEVADHRDGLSLATEQPASEILRLISSDLQDLARPVMAFRTLPVEGESAEPLLRFADGRPMLVAGTPGASERRGATSQRLEDGDGMTSNADVPVPRSRGLVVYFASAPQLDWTNLPGRPLMVPLMHEIVRQGLSSVRGMERVVAGERPVLSAAAREFVGRQGESIAVEEGGRPQRAITRADVYELRDAAGQRLTSMAVNIDPRGARTQTHAPAAVMAWLNGAAAAPEAAAATRWSNFDRANPANALMTAEGGSPIAWMLLWIVLALIAFETLLQRWFSHATREGEAREFGGLRGGIRATIHRTRAVIGSRDTSTAGGSA